MPEWVKYNGSWIAVILICIIMAIGGVILWMMGVPTISYAWMH